MNKFVLGLLSLCLFFHTVYPQTLGAVLKGVSIVNNEAFTFTNFAVLVTLDTQTLISSGNMNFDGSDLRFTQFINTTGLLYYRFVPGTFNTTKTLVEVKIPSIAPGTTRIWMWYKNASLITPTTGAFNDYVFPTTSIGGGFLAYDSITINQGTTVSVLPGSNVVTLIANRIVINGTITGKASGTPGRFLGGLGLGVGQWSISAGAAGSGYGGNGGSGGRDFGETLNNGGGTYGSASSLDIDLGSPGAGSSFAAGGAAGATIKILANVIEIGPNAVLDVSGGNGGAGNPGAGGGSGGGLLVWGNSVRVDGSLRALGGDGATSFNDADNGGGGGGGGRIKIFYRVSLLTNTTGTFVYNVSAGKGGCCGNDVYGTDGQVGSFFSGQTASSPVIVTIVDDSGTCVPIRNCASVGAFCGTIDDGCNQLVSCGTCNAGFFCGSNYTCLPGTQDTTQAPVITGSNSGTLTAPTESKQSGSGSNVGLIVGVIFGVLAILICFGILILLAILVLRKNLTLPTVGAKRKQEDVVELSADVASSPPDSSSTNYVGISLSKSLTRGSVDLNTSQRTSALKMNGSRGHLSSTWEINYAEIRMERELGRGGYGIVFLGTWRNQKVAVKKIKEEGFSQKQIDDFKAEAQVYMNLRPHKNVVIFLGVSLSPLCIVTEYLENGSLESWIKKDVKLDMGTVLKMARDIAAGMSHLHAEGIVHRDLAARNLLLDENMNVKITDFGMSRVLTTEANNTASEVGPLKWMAPESITKKEYSFKSDVYMYGMTLIELLTRNDPYPLQSPMEVAILIVRDGYRHPIPDYTPPELADLINQCWKTNPDERPDFQSVFQILQEM